MTDKMKLLLTRASSQIGVADGDWKNILEAQRNGWIKSIGYRQNSTTQRFRITEEGQAALGGA